MSIEEVESRRSLAVAAAHRASDNSARSVAANRGEVSIAEILRGLWRNRMVLYCRATPERLRRQVAASSRDGVLCELLFVGQSL
uniref:Uncharacterized protein n=1 Tax=Physcomitrium patens TaxID=3218 RepID=A0A2K1KJW7_PHYPA|nr:hypothetical protein PHYPA_007746 [Physcomitrium patens]